MNKTTSILPAILIFLLFQWHNYQASLVVAGTPQKITTKVNTQRLNFEKKASKTNWWNPEYPYRIKATVDSGMYNRKDCLVSVLINVNAFTGTEKAPHPNSVRAINCDSLKEVPSLFKADHKDPNLGIIYWLMPGNIEPLTEKDFYLYFGSKEKSLTKPVDFTLKDIEEDGNLIINGGFENQGQWKTRSQPDKKAFCKFTEDQAHSGKRSFVISNHNKRIPEYATYSQIFTMQPNTRYTLSVWQKVTHVPDYLDGFTIAQVTFLDEFKHRQKPPKEKNYRLYAVLATGPARAEKEDFLGKWIRKKTSGITPRWAKYGRIKLFTYHFVGTVYFDDISLKKVTPEPPTATIGQIESLSNNN